MYTNTRTDDVLYRSIEKKHKLNICLIRESLHTYGGAERVMSVLANELSSFYNVYVINHFINKSAYYINKKVESYFLNDKKYRLRETIFSDTRKLRKFILEKRIDCLILVGRTSVLISLLATLRTNTKVIFFDQMSLSSYDYQKSSFKQKLYNALVQNSVKFFTNKIVVLTSKTKQEYIKRYNIDSEHLVTIYNFLDKKLHCECAKYNFDSKKIISVGRIDFAKGYEYLICVAKKVFEKHPEWEWHVFGNGDVDYEQKIKNKINESGLGNNLKLKGISDRIYDLYSEYSFLVLTSRYEGFALVLLEAKAKKLPLVSFDINSGPSDIIRDKEDGYLIEPFDVDEMANKICKLIENKELRKRFSNNSYGNIDKFKKEFIIKQWCELLDNI